MAKNSIGHVAQVMGAVVDVKFDDEKDLPSILSALETKLGDKNLVWKSPSSWGNLLYAVSRWIRPTALCAVRKSLIPARLFLFRSARKRWAVL